MSGTVEPKLQPTFEPTAIPANEDMPVTKDIYEQLAYFRYQLRKFLHFSETAAREQGITPQTHQLMLSVKGYPGRDYATISELAERLQITHHACVGLVNRSEKQGYVYRTPNPSDGRSIYVHLTEEGAAILERLSQLHWKELNRIGIGGFPQRIDMDD
jgi:DNA-binding MarR family transcriptional regulator